MCVAEINIHKNVNQLLDDELILNVVSVVALFFQTIAVNLVQDPTENRN